MAAAGRVPRVSWVIPCEFLVFSCNLCRMYFPLTCSMGKAPKSGHELYG
eukprot:COSAG06_NODE_65471_length_257_cov_0.537975_1_plen_48_part_10